MHAIMWLFLTVCHHGTDFDFMCFCMSLENRPQLVCQLVQSLIQELFYRYKTAILLSYTSTQ